MAIRRRKGVLLSAFQPRLEIVDDGLFPETIEAVARSVPGMHLLEAAVGSPAIESGGCTPVTLCHLVTDRSVAPAGNVPVRARRWWGSVSTEAAYDEDAYGRAWHHSTVDELCGKTGESRTVNGSLRSS